MALLIASTHPTRSASSLAMNRYSAPLGNLGDSEIGVVYKNVWFTIIYLYMCTPMHVHTLR